MNLKITQTLNERNLEIALESRLDTVSAPELEAELRASLDRAESLMLKL